MTSLIVDASVAVLWYLPEALSGEAEQILAAQADLMAPELVIAEIGNAVWKRTARNEVSAEEAVNVVVRASAIFTKLFPLRELAPEAMRLSATLNHPIYDCFYLALAARENAPLVTADRKLATLGGRAGVQVELLG